jgi:ribosomal protein S18 acetylase RimI-like enzyme
LSAIAAQATGGYRQLPQDWDDDRVTTIRFGAPADATDLTGIHVRGWQRAYAGLMPDRFLAELRVDDPVRIERWRARLAEPGGGRTVVAVDPDSGAVGFASFGPDREDPDAGEVYAIYVDPDRLGTGMGRALMDEAVARLRQRGFTRIRLWVLAGNARAIAFYERYGFRPDGGRSTFVIEQPGELPLELPEVRLGLDVQA